MCGIVGYIGRRNASNVLVEGLERLSYRGYDSAGIALMDHTGKIAVRKTKGKLVQLQKKLTECPLEGKSGIGHTRWATHGEPNEQNAHPHTDAAGGIAVVHNGIIENHEALRKHLQDSGVVFASETDTEVIAHLLNKLYDGSMLHTLLRAQGLLKGSYAIAVLCEKEPDRLFSVRCDSPLIAAFCDGEGFLASDIPALLRYTRDVTVLQERQAAVLSVNGLEIYDEYGTLCKPTVRHVDWNEKSAEKGGFAHFMLKEIYEQPSALQSTFMPRSDFSNFNWLPIDKETARCIEKVTIIGCGTAYHAGLIGKAAMERLAHIQAEADVASEYRYRKPIVKANELVIAVTQSGETADTLAALREARKRGAMILAICNTVGSSISRETGEERVLYTYAGPEIAVASTKAYSTQTELLILLSAALGIMRGVLSEERVQKLYRSLREISGKAEETLKLKTAISQIANRMSGKKHVFFIGRGIDYAIACEGALKLKEVSYLFSEAYAAGELKHGPIALLQAGSLVIACVTQSDLLEKMLLNLREIHARGAVVVAVCDRALAEKVMPNVDECLVIPNTDEWLAPLLTIIPLQLFAYCMAVERGCDVDQPRNLAKSVTVE